MNDDGVLHQNGQSCGWTFSKLDDASKRLKDTMHLTGIRLKDTEIHSVLLFQGKGEVEDSVSTGGRLLDAYVAKTTNELLDILKRPLGDGAKMNHAQMSAVQEFLLVVGHGTNLKLTTAQHWRATSEPRQSSKIGGRPTVVCRSPISGVG